MGGHDDVTLLFQQQPLHGVVEDVLGHGDIQGGKWVVQKQSCGRRVDSAGQSDASLLTTRYVGTSGTNQRRILALQHGYIIVEGARLQHFGVALGVHLTTEEDVVPQRGLNKIVQSQSFCTELTEGLDTFFFFFFRIFVMFKNSTYFCSMG